MPASVTLKTAPPIKSKPVEISVSYPRLVNDSLTANTAGGGSIGEVQKLSTYVLHRIDDSHSPDANCSYTHEQVDYFFFVIGEASGGLARQIL